MLNNESLTFLILSLGNVYSFTLSSEDVSSGSNHLVGRVEAEDEDQGENGRVSYALTNGTDLQAFQINTRTGEIRTTKELTEER